ncbi:unnamed protein product [Rhizoctonia solani]|uniref:Uncharacterized protein n=1 Tax=Rhizoctonia solani TaxID=456999 RepID=A0A8H3C5Y5_9AGAM|nr:unnamed protein product [Rhizoctonia solani]
MAILSALAVLSGWVGEHVRALARTAAAENVRDVFSTFPADLTQIQQRTVISAAEVAGMKLVALINDGTTSIRRSLCQTRQFSTRELHMRCDSSAAATLVAFHTITVPAINKPTKPESITQTTSLGYGFDTLASGTELTRPIQTVLEAKVRTNLKSESINRLCAREAERIKSISGVTDEANAGAEGLVGDNDFKTKLERKARPRTCSGGSSRTLWMELAPVFWRADVESVILHGQNARIRFVQTVAKNDVSLVKLTTDADEACVLGTAFYATSLSRHFRTQPVKVQDASFAKFTRVMLPSTRSRAVRIIFSVPCLAR